MQTHQGKTEGGQTTVYIGRHFEKNTTTGVIAKYYEALGQPVATSQTGVGISYLYRDHVGSTTAASNGSTRSYWPFGAQRSSSGTTPTDRLYTGQRLDSIGLYDYGAREYDPQLGRFIQPDTIVPNPGNPQSFNRYAYVNDNPLGYVDPTGHCANPASTAAGCPGWMPDLAFEGANVVVALTVMGTAYAPNEEGRPGDLAGVVASDEGNWYQGMGLGVINVIGYADAANRCLSDGCSPVTVGLALIHGVSGRSERLFTRLGGSLTSELTNRLKDRFRDEARKILQSINPDKFDVHHRLPLEWAHIFGELDPNRLSNLVGLRTNRHIYVDNKWTELRHWLNGRIPSRDELLNFVQEIDERIATFPKADVVLPP